MKITLIGGAGFIGHSLAKALTSHEVSVIDSLMINNLYSLNGNIRYQRFIKERLDILNNLGISVHLADARDYDVLSRIVDALSPNVVIHLAAVAHVSVSQKSPFTTFDHSLRTLENALDVSVETGVKRFIYFSSSTVYGDWTREAMAEYDTCQPIGIYGSLKLAGELMVKGYQQAKDLKYNIVRPSALYGPRCISGRVIQKFIEQAQLGHDLVASTEMLDFTHIDDLVDGVCRVVTGPENETFNLTYGQAVKVTEVARIIAELLNVNVTVGNEKPLADRGTLDISKARKMLGYEPINPVAVGVRRYVDWYQRNS